MSAIALLALAACGGDSTAPAEDIASIVVTGSPSVPVLVGDSVQLVATPVNASGAVVANRSVSWKSSDGNVAAVASNGLVRALGPGVATITASAGGKDGTASFRISLGGLVGNAGATFASRDSAIVLTVPPFALSQAVTVLLTPTTNAPPSSRLVAGSVWELGPDGLYLQKMGSFALKYDPAKLPTGVLQSTLQMYGVYQGRWALMASTVDTVKHVVTAVIVQSGVFALIGDPVTRVVVGGAAAGGALYVGQSSQLTYTPYDSAGALVKGRPASWSTSDSRVATVDAAGNVTAVGAGDATITATVEGKSGSTSVTIVARPQADWSAAVEWTTYQGNAAHTGYVPVTVDPGVFKEKWTTPVFNAPLRPVVAGDGYVFVTTNSYFGLQRASTIEIATMDYKWTYDFGGIASVDAPAFGNGTMYVMTGGHEDSYLYAIVPAGDHKWRTPYANQWSVYYAPVVVNGVVYTAGGYYGGMYAFDAVTGAQKWFFNTNQYDQWSPAVVNGVVYAYTGSYSPRVDAVDAATGTSLYSIKDSLFNWNGWSMQTAPVIGGTNDLLATNGGRLISFDLANRRIGWQIKETFTGQLTLANGVVYVLNGAQVQARKESDGSLLWSWQPPSDAPTGTMIATKNMLFVRTATAVYAVDLALHKTMWSYPATGELTLSAQGVLFIAQSNGKLTAITAR